MSAKWKCSRVRYTPLVVKAITLSRVVDRAYRLFAYVRASVILRMVSTAVQDAYSEASHGNHGPFRPDHPSFRSVLFHWEQRALAEFFPDPPGRVLVGGAGGGREALALASLGYGVVAFDPCRQLVELLSNYAPPSVEVYLGAYQDLPVLLNFRSGRREQLDEETKYDAAIMGWTSFSHLRSREQRLEVLRYFSEMTEGPVLLSFETDAAGGRNASSGTWWIPLRNKVFSGDRFFMNGGFVHCFQEEGIRELLNEAELEILALCMDDSSYPYAVVKAKRTRGKTGSD